MKRVLLISAWLVSLAGALRAGRFVRESGQPEAKRPSRIGPAPEVTAKGQGETRPERPREENPDGADGPLPAGMRDVLADPSGVSRMEKWVACMASATAADMQSVAELLEGARRQGRFYFSETSLFWNRWGALDPKAAIAWREAHINKEVDTAGSQLVAGWASRDPLAALEWVRAPGKFIDPVLLEGIFSAWAATDPAAAGACIVGMPPADPVRSPATAAAFVRGVWQSKGKAGVSAWLETFATSFQGDMTFPKEVFKSLGRVWAQSNDGSAALDFARSHIGKPWFDAGGLNYCLSPYKGDPGKVMDAVASLPPDPVSGKYYGVAPAIIKWVRDDPEGPGKWLIAHPDFAGSDQLAEAYSSALKKRDPAAAQHWAQSIKEETLRARALQYLREPSK